MRIVGYAREFSDRSHAGSIFAQSERIRRWAAEQGYQLLAMCQDVRSPSGEPGDEGFRALLEIVGAGHADAVVVPMPTSRFSPMPGRIWPDCSFATSSHVRPRTHERCANALRSKTNLLSQTTTSSSS